ncbi:hypothetical protein D0O09_15785 [Pseudomonas putida]|nr:hypothetical protein D0O09_15785 [Pseudomonas putida]
MASTSSGNTLARWVIQCSEYSQPLLNLMRGRLLESPVIHCNKTCVQVLKEPDRDPISQSWMWVQASGRLIDKSYCSITPPAVRRRCRCACWRAIAAR